MDPRTRQENRNWAGGVVAIIVVLAALYVAFALLRGI
jgi:hypothetical protein